METKLNIAEILKDKPKGTKLYSPLFGNVCFSGINDSKIYALQHNSRVSFYKDGCYFKYEEAEPLLFPSKEMRDWSKFAWKKGDVLVSKGRRILHVIFEGFNDDTYTTFKGKHYLCDYSDKEDYDEEYYNDYHKEVNERIIEFEKDNVNNAQTYINIIEKRLGGKLNLETLEIEKSEFKDGDILCVIANSTDYHYILIYEGQDDEHIYRYVTMLENHSLIIEKGSYFTKPKDYSIRYATEEEKQQLFDALAKEGKAWDAEKKQIVDLKPKIELKPFDKVLIRDCSGEIWRPSFFARYLTYGRDPYQVIGGERVKLCIPYEGNESLLGTNKNVES